MNKSLLLATAALLSTTIAWAGINYNGTALQENTEFTRTQCGTMGKKTMPETSGMACSRQTPGYLWAHGDENTGKKRKIVAVDPAGTLTMTVNITTTGSDRDDWEDICTGVVNGTNYIFVGAIGDNNLAFKDQYYIYYFAEPAITSGSTTTVTANSICFGYPDNNAHNTETLMFDNIEQMFYVVDKVENGVCHLYKLPFSATYGTTVQKLTEVCALGNGSVFNYCTGGDITPDGQWMAIKSKPYVLLWERQGSESLSVTAQRDPVQVMAYQEEAQGESLAWDDASTFYTTSDQKSDIPIYKYVRAVDPSVASVTGITIDGKPLVGYDPETTTYNYELDYGTTIADLPVIAASAANDGVVNVTLPTSLPGTATITCMSKNGQNMVQYTISLTVSATPSADASLASLSVDGAAIAGFQPDVYSYSIVIPYTAEVPVISAVSGEKHATVQVNNLTEVTKTPTNASVVVVAQDGVATHTYYIAISRADAIKKVNEVIMTNKYSAFIPQNDSTRIQAYYLAGEAVPTIASHIEETGTTWSQSGSVITLTGVDGTSETYNLVVEPVTPVDFTPNEIVCDGTETWIKGGYGWDNSKKWKFSKTDSDYTREMNGKTHVELVLPACDTLVLTPNSGTERDVRFFINGVEFGSKTKFVKTKVTLAVLQSAPFMLTVASAQTSGDGGVAAIRMARKSTTALDDVKLNNVQCTKFMHDGQILIKRGEHVFTVEGLLVR